MAKTVAERQHDYRARRRLIGDDVRLNLWISARAYSALERLSERRGMTKREMIDLLLITVDIDVSAISKLDTLKWEGYFSSTSVTP